MSPCKLLAVSGAEARHILILGQSIDRLCCACSWAAYVVGALLVLMHELGHVFHHGLSLLVSSDVPDGKGVSSSAALEVAAMSAITAAYGIDVEPARLASLCQKVAALLTNVPESECIGAHQSLEAECSTLSLPTENPG